MHRSRLNPTLELDQMAIHKKQAADHSETPYTRGPMTYATVVEAPSDLTPEELQQIAEHEALCQMTAVAALPEPLGGHRANLLTFCIRARVNDLDTRPEWPETLKREFHYQGLRLLTRAADQQTGKSDLVCMMSNWLEYLQQTIGGSPSGDRLNPTA